MKKLFEKFNFDGLLLTYLLCNTLYSATYPYIYKNIMNCISDDLLSIKTIIISVFSVLIPILWNSKLNKKLFNLFIIFCSIEPIVYILLFIYIMIDDNLAVYFIIDCFIASSVTKNISCGLTKIKSIRYNTSNKRERYDNNYNIIYSISSLLGVILFTIFKFNFTTMLIISIIANILDNITYIIIYIKMRRVG